ncbi:MAG: hypothetical protein A2Y25_01480 [Candidatus Melainabacteria bacterium GWF2_37_15]|nr:MAG: hypothetical protein A2Y25_01480 [Candidatus Melainabacteria bacterium GWF2_37_15]
MEQCKTCQGGCCRRYNIHLWGSDIIKICNALKVDISFFTYAYHIEEDKIENLKGKDPLFIFTDSGKEEYFILILKSNESKYYPDTLKCIFLQEWSADALGSEELSGIIGRCGIYGIRPVTCRAWPAGYEEETQNIVIRDPHLILEKKHKRTSDSPALDICKNTLTHQDYINFEAQYIEDSIINHHEKQFFLKVAEKWNKNPDISDNFYKFLVKEYNNRIEYIKGEVVYGTV